MAPPIACLVPGGRLAPAASARIAAETRPATISSFSLSAYRAAPRPPGRLVLCPAGRSVEADLRYLSRVAQCLLWPRPPGGFQDAIAGIRAPGRVETDRRGRRAPSSGEQIAAALLLEGEVSLQRARRALAARGPCQWIVEDPRCVRIPERSLRALVRAGVRWSSLEGLEIVALYASPALARARPRLRRVLPPRTPIWVRS